MKYLYLDKGGNRKKGSECLALLAYVMTHSIANDYSQQCDSILEGWEKGVFYALPQLHINFVQHLQEYNFRPFLAHCCFQGRLT